MTEFEKYVIDVLREDKSVEAADHRISLGYLEVDGQELVELELSTDLHDAPADVYAEQLCGPREMDAIDRKVNPPIFATMAREALPFIEAMNGAQVVEGLPEKTAEERCQQVAKDFGVDHSVVYEILGEDGRLKYIEAAFKLGVDVACCSVDGDLYRLYPDALTREATAACNALVQAVFQKRLEATPIDTVAKHDAIAKCECGADKCGTTHSDWCPKHFGKAGG